MRVVGKRLTLIMALQIDAMALTTAMMQLPMAPKTFSMQETTAPIFAVGGWGVVGWVGLVVKDFGIVLR